jgi:hypothetical protein
MKGQRHIVITRDDMARLRELVRQGRKASRRDQGHLAELDRELDRAEIIGAEELSPDVVTMHSTVRVLDLDTDSSRVYTLVFPVEADIEAEDLGPGPGRHRAHRLPCRRPRRMADARRYEAPSDRGSRLPA